MHLKVFFVYFTAASDKFPKHVSMAIDDTAKMYMADLCISMAEWSGVFWGY